MLSALGLALDIGLGLMVAFTLVLLCKMFKHTLLIGFSLIGLFIAGFIGLALAGISSILIAAYELLFVLIVFVAVILISKIFHL